MVHGCGWLVGGRNICTLKIPPSVICVGKVNTVSPVTKRSSPALSCNSTVSPVASTRPTTDPLILNPGCVQRIATLLTFEVTVPVPFTTEQTCGGLEGCVSTVTA